MRDSLWDIVSDIFEEVAGIVGAVVIVMGGLFAYVVIAERIEQSAERSRAHFIIQGGDLNRRGGVDTRVGDCLVDARHWSTDPDVVTRVPCSEPHEFEVFARFDLPQGRGTPYPGEAEVAAFAEAMCDARFAEYVGRPIASSELTRRSWYPHAEGWRDGDRSVECWLEASGGPRLEGSMAGSGR